MKRNFLKSLSVILLALTVLITGGRFSAAAEETSGMANDEPLLTGVSYEADSQNANVYNFTLTGTNLNERDIFAKASKSEYIESLGIAMPTPVDVLISDKSVNEEKTSATFALTFPNESTDIEYTVKFSVTGRYGYTDTRRFDKVITVTAAGGTSPSQPSENESVITKVSYNGVFSIQGTNLIKERLKVKVMLEDSRKTEIENSLSEIMFSSTSAFMELTFPENNGSTALAYTVYFNADGSDNFSDAHKVTVTVEPAGSGSSGNGSSGGSNGGNNSSETGSITLFKANNPSLSSKGGDAKVTVKGEKLSTLVLKVIKLADGAEQDTDIVPVFAGADTVGAVTFSLPEVSDGSIVTYKLKAGFSSDSFTHEAEFSVGGSESLEMIELHPQTVYIDSENKNITLLFDQKIELVSTLEKLKNGISINNSRLDGSTSTDSSSSINFTGNNGNFVPLSSEDTVEIHPYSIIIRLNTALNEVSQSTSVKFAERLIKTVINGKNGLEEKEARTFTALVRSGQPIVLDGEFLEGEILDNSGGNVRIRITGEYLNLTKKNSDEKLVKVSVEKAENQKLGEAAKTSLPAEIEYKSNKEILVSFTAPANSSTISESYLIRVSHDGGFKYTSEIGANTSDERFRRLITTVLPAGADKAAPIISYISIQSYGTSGGGAENPDTTHTNLPIIQESKKTRLHVYGANLNEKLTKIKIVDKHGVIWYPLANEGSSDSADNFITVAFNGTGIAGNGTFQKIEIICPRNVAGEPTYKYILAPDGKNYTENIFVTATVLDDGIGKKNELNPQDIKISYKTTNNEDILPAVNTRGYSFVNVRSFGIREKQIDGYKLLGFKFGKSDGSLSELHDVSKLYAFDTYVRDNTSVDFIYERLNTSSQTYYTSSEDTQTSSDTAKTDSPADTTPAKDTAAETAEALPEANPEANAKVSIADNKAAATLSLKTVNSSLQDITDNTLVVNADTKDASALSLKLTKSVLKALTGSDVKHLQINSDIADVSLKLSSVKKYIDKNLSLNVSKSDNGTFTVKLTELKGTAPLSITGKLTISVKSDKKASVYTVGKNGKLKKVASSYNSETGLITVKLKNNAKFVIK